MKVNITEVADLSKSTKVTKKMNSFPGIPIRTDLTDTTNVMCKSLRLLIAFLSFRSGHWKMLYKTVAQ